MAISNLSAQKRVRQNNKKEKINKCLKNQIKTYYKKFLEANDNKNKKDAAGFLKKYISLLDKAGMRNVLHKNNCSRKKSAAVRIFNLIQKDKKEKKEENA